MGFFEIMQNIYKKYNYFNCTEYRIAFIEK